MKKMISASLVTFSLAISCTALAQSVDNYHARAVKNCPHGASNENIERALWAPHIKVHNDTNHVLVVYANNTAMTLYPDDKVDYYFPITTWGPQPFVIRQDDSEANVIFNDKVSNETYFHIMAIDYPDKPVFKFFPEPMH